MGWLYMLTIATFKKMLDNFYSHLSSDAQTIVDTQMMDVFKAMFEHQEDREINESEIYHFFNKGLYLEITKVNPLDANYKNICRLVNAFFQNPDLKEDDNLLAAIQDLTKLGVVDPLLLTNISTHKNAIAFCQACLMVKNEKLFEALYHSTTPLIAAEALQLGIENNFIGTLEQQILLIKNNNPNEAITAIIKFTGFMQQSPLSSINVHDMIEALLIHDHPLNLINAFIRLNNENIALNNEQTFSFIAQEKPDVMVDYLINADHLEKLFNLTNIKTMVLKHPQPEKLISSLLDLRNNHISLLTSADLDLVMKNNHFTSIIESIIQLNKTNVMLLHRDNIEMILHHKKPQEFASALNKLIALKNDISQEDLDHINDTLVKKANFQSTALSPKFFHQAYNHRDVIGLKELTNWTENEEQMHLQLNRILQPGFMHREPTTVLADVKLAKFAWITDCCCPSVHAAMMLHIGKEMVVNYKVKDNELNIVAHQIYHSMLAYDADISLKLENQIQQKMEDMMKSRGELNEEALNKLAMEILKKNKVEPQTPQAREAAKRLAIDIARKKITDELVSLEVKKYVEKNIDSLNLEKKSVHNIGTTHDYCFLGAAGSGKSTIAKQYFDEEQKADYIILATDNYRAFTLSNTEKHEEKLTKNVFIKTQDIAFMVKDLVQQELNTQMNNEHTRSNVICDCLSLDPQMRNLLAQGKTTSVVAAYRGEPGYVGIAERANARAHDVNAAPADKGRFVQTTALLKGHADASQQLLSSVPNDTITTVYDTQVDMGSQPVKIATIDSKLHFVEINNLRVMSEFLNKRSININAINQVDLILHKEHASLSMLATHAEIKANSLLSLLQPTKYNSAYTIKLSDKNGHVYAELALDGKKVKLSILDQNEFLRRATGESIEASVLRAVTRQVEKGSFQESLTTANKEGDKQSFASAFEAITMNVNRARYVSRS